MASCKTSEETQLVDNQLKRILISKQFKSAKQLQRFLKYVVEKTIIGEGKLLKQYTIGIEALLLADDFDPDTNPSVRIMGGRVRQRLTEYYDDTGINDELIISMPKGSYIPEFKKNTHTKSNKNANLQTSRGPTLALVSFSDKTQNQTTNKLLLQSTDTVATELSRFLCLHLVVCNPYADKDQSHLVEAEMKSSGRADYILALYLQQFDNDENKYRLIYRLILVDTGVILWSENYVVNGRPIEEQDYILGKITATVADHLQGMMHAHWSRKLLENIDTIPDCYEVLAYFRYYTDRLGRGAFAKGVNFCLKTLNRNPNDVIANVIYSAYCRHEYVYGYGVIESPLEKGKECAETAIRLSPNSHEAHYVLGQILFCQKEWKHSVEEFELARSLCKNNIVIEFGVGFHFCMMNLWDKGLPLVKKAMLLSTSYPSIYHMIPFLDYYRKEKYEEALYEAKKITTPGLVHGPLTRSISYAQLGEFEKAEKEFQEVLRRYPKFMQTGGKFVARFLGTEILAEKVWRGVIKISNHSKSVN
jgi:tetratricopeptide (TPR) repeat protein